MELRRLGFQELKCHIAILVKRYNMIDLLLSDFRTPNSYNLQTLLDSEMIHNGRGLEL